MIVIMILVLKSVNRMRKITRITRLLMKELTQYY